MGVVDSTRDAVRRNVDTKIAVSAAVGLALFGVVTSLAVRSGIKPLQQAANIAKGKK